MEEEIIEVPKWILEEIHDVLRMYVQDEHCEKRETCRDRQTMVAYNMVSQLIKTGQYEYNVKHLLEYGQTPD